MLVSDGITDGYRESNVIALGATPDANEVAEALRILNNFRKTVLGYEFGENLQDWLIPNTNQQCPYDLGLIYLTQTPWYLGPYQNRRLLLSLTENTTVFFPNNPDPGARMSVVVIDGGSFEFTIDGNGRFIEGQSTLVFDTATQANRKTWFYRADLASWELIEDIEEDDASFPLEDDFDDLWVSYLAIRLGPRNNVEPSETVLSIYKNTLARAKARYRQTENIGVQFRTTTESQQAFVNAAADWSPL